MLLQLAELASMNDRVCLWQLLGALSDGCKDLLGHVPSQFL